MKRHIRLKRNIFEIRPKDIVVLIILLIIILTVFIFMKFNKYVTPKILSVANMRLNNMTSVIVERSFSKEILKPELVNDIIVIKLDGNGEINEVDFNIENVYEIASLVSREFHLNFSYIENGQLDKLEYYDSNQIRNSDGYIMALPVGIASGNVFLSNLGPKIPVKVKFMGTVLTSVRTKVTDYGINNALIEVYLDISIERQIITPVVNEVLKIPYEMLISSKIIYGKVPQFYAGLYEKSSLLNIPITN